MVVLCSGPIRAQLSFTPFLSFNKLGGANMVGFGGRMELEGIGKKSDGTTPLYGGVALGFGSAKGMEYGYAFSSTTNPSSIEIPVTYKFSLIHIFIGGKRYFGKGDYDDGGFYGLGDVGLMLVPLKSKLDSYNPALYYTTVVEKETLSDLMFAFGLGYEADLDFAKFFGEGKLAIPSSGVNSREGTDSPLGIGLALNVGMRFAFGR